MQSVDRSVGSKRSHIGSGAISTDRLGPAVVQCAAQLRADTEADNGYVTHTTRLSLAFRQLSFARELISGRQEANMGNCQWTAHLAETCTQMTQQLLFM